MEKLNEKVDYSTEGIVKSINQLLMKINKLEELILALALQSNSPLLEEKVSKVMKM